VVNTIFAFFLNNIFNFAPFTLEIWIGHY